jgi:light-regulated signal transduction histidine kinase (bacteriophytochrome)
VEQYLPLVRALEAVLRATAHLQAALTSVARQQVELERSNRELEQFAVVVSHDLREPLRTITSYTQLLAHRYHGQLDQDADDFIALTVASAQRMGQRIDALLALAHFNESGEEFRPTSLTTVLEEVLADLHSQLQAAQATVQCAALPTVRGDAGQLRALFQNLLTNAVKFHHPDRPPHVRLSATKGKDQWEIRVTDNGIGIAAEHRERIFEVFRRLHTSKDYEGLGMGLAICKKIVERHGGHIHVESTPDQGTTFVLTLPA